MSKSLQILRIVLGLAVIAVIMIACGPPETIEETFTEEEVIEGQYIFCTDEGLALDLQPGKIVCSGPYEGQELVLELVPVVQGGKAYLQAQSMTLDGEDAPPQDLAETNEALAEDLYTPEEDYTVTAFTITHDSLTIVSTLTSTLSEAELATLTAPLPTATPSPIVETFTEAEFNEPGFLCPDFGLVVDLRPGKLVCSGVLEGDKVVIEMVAVVADGTSYFEVQNFTIDGEQAAESEYTDINAGLREERFMPEEGYVITDMTITDEEVIITSEP